MFKFEYPEESRGVAGHDKVTNNLKKNEYNHLFNRIVCRARHEDFLINGMNAKCV